MVYYNRKLDNALQRHRDNKWNIKDLYYRELLTFKKDYTKDGVTERWMSFFDVIMDSYEYTHLIVKSEIFLLLLSCCPNSVNGYSFIKTHRDLVVAGLSLFGIKDFQFAYDRSFYTQCVGIDITELSNEFVSNYGVLGKDRVTLEDGVIQIHGEVNTTNILGG